MFTPSGGLDFFGRLEPPREGGTEMHGDVFEPRRQGGTERQCFLLPSCSLVPLAPLWLKHEGKTALLFPPGFLHKINPYLYCLANPRGEHFCPMGGCRLPEALHRFRPAM